jgi:L-alanine-DL-glutamate epimerase-like enolase superfamily enzyme
VPGSGVVIAAIDVEPLSIPLREPFVIATGRIDTTRAALVRVTVETPEGARATGLGEAAALPPVTREDQPEVLAELGAAAATLKGADVGDSFRGIFTDELPLGRVAKAGLEAALSDAVARLAGVPLYEVLGRSGESGAYSTELLTDITLPISDPERMSANARAHRRAGFTIFKVKVGRDWRADLASLRAVAAAVPDARFRLDANAGFAARDALALLDAVLAAGLLVECFEQPCGADDLAGMAEVAAHSAVPVVADESLRGPEDLVRIVGARAAQGVNLKLAKLGGPAAAQMVGLQARVFGLRLMAGAMVETRLGLLAMAHVVAALGGVDWVDLDTAFLLADDPFFGGWTCDGPRIHLTGDPGLGVSLR